MAKLTVGQAQAVNTIVKYLAGKTTSSGEAIRTAEDAAAALGQLAADATATLKAGTGTNDAHDAIAAVERQRTGLEEVFGFWNYRGPWTPEARARMMPVAAADAASLKDFRNRLYRAYRTPWQPVEEQAVTSDGR